MPELPEARTIARRLHDTVADRRIRRVRLRRRDMLKTGSPATLKRLTGQRLGRVGTRGKYVVLHTQAGRLIVQLGMAGRILVCSGDAPPGAHTHLVLELDDGRRVHYDNVRRIAGGGVDRLRGRNRSFNRRGLRSRCGCPVGLLVALRGGGHTHPPASWCYWPVGSPGHWPPWPDRRVRCHRRTTHTENGEYAVLGWNGAAFEENT